METLSSFMSGFELSLNKTFAKKNPLRLPKNIRLNLVALMPYLIAVSIIPNILGLLITLEIYNNSIISFIAGIGGFVTFYSPSAFATIGQSTFVMLTINVVWILLMGLAIPRLLARQHEGWYYVFCASLVVIAESLIYMQIVRLIFNAIFIWYILFQIRQHYNHKAA